MGRVKPRLPRKSRTLNFPKGLGGSWDSINQGLGFRVYAYLNLLPLFLGVLSGRLVKPSRFSDSVLWNPK